MKNCMVCNTTHRNRKYDKCNQCLGRKKCINEDSKEIKLTGICLIDDY